jgi:uncharacterized protein
MAVTRQLYELQEVDINIESTRQTLGLKTHQLGNHDTIDKAAAILAAAQKELEELKKQRRDAETEAADINNKIIETNKQLYSGRTSNPKELSNLQAEVKALTNQKDQIDTKTLEIIDKLEEAEKKTTAFTADFQKMDADWQKDQAQMVKDIELLKQTLVTLEETRRDAATKIDPPNLVLYERVRRMKKTGVAKVERGICQSCRLSLSASALQKARAGHAVQCGTCGRILFIS